MAKQRSHLCLGRTCPPPVEAPRPRERRGSAARQAPSSGARPRPGRTERPRPGADAPQVPNKTTAHARNAPAAPAARAPAGRAAAGAEREPRMRSAGRGGGCGGHTPSCGAAGSVRARGRLRAGVPEWRDTHANTHGRVSGTEPGPCPALTEAEATVRGGCVTCPQSSGSGWQRPDQVRGPPSPQPCLLLQGASSEPSPGLWGVSAWHPAAPEGREGNGRAGPTAGRCSPRQVPCSLDRLFGRPGEEGAV